MSVWRGSSRGLSVFLAIGRSTVDILDKEIVSQGLIYNIGDNDELSAVESQFDVFIDEKTIQRRKKAPVHLRRVD